MFNQIYKFAIWLRGRYNKANLLEHSRLTAKEIKKIIKLIESHRKSLTKNEEEGEKDDDLLARIEKIKQKRQKEIQNEKEWRQMNDENDEIISRLNRLKPVEPVLQPEPDIELLAKEEERTRLRDEYFDRKEKQERAELAKKCAIKHESEPVQNSEPNNDEIIEEYNILDEDAKILLLNWPKMAKKAFIKKLDIYSIVMRKKLI